MLLLTVFSSSCCFTPRLACSAATSSLLPQQQPQPPGSSSGAMTQLPPARWSPSMTSTERMLPLTTTMRMCWRRRARGGGGRHREARQAVRRQNGHTPLHAGASSPDCLLHRAGSVAFDLFVRAAMAANCLHHRLRQRVARSFLGVIWVKPNTQNPKTQWIGLTQNQKNIYQAGWVKFWVNQSRPTCITSRRHGHLFHKARRFSLDFYSLSMENTY
jgi:hypothetical protein